MTVAASLDTNVLVRLIVQDDAQQSQVVANMFQGYAQREASLWIAVTVVLELEWVLRSRYKFPKADFLRVMSALLMAVELVFESEDALEQSLVSYEDGDADYAEYLHLALAKKGNAIPFLTFDQKAARANGAQLLQ